jgi:hypothetical protein
MRKAISSNICPSLTQSCAGGCGISCIDMTHIIMFHMIKNNNLRESKFNQEISVESEEIEITNRIKLMKSSTAFCIPAEVFLRPHNTTAFAEINIFSSPKFAEAQN